MKQRTRTLGLGCVATIIALGCSSTTRPLGDEPTAGGEGPDGTDTGGASVLPTAGKAGATQNNAAGSGGTTQDDPTPVAGAAAVDCWSPVHAVDEVSDPDAPGCACSEAEATCVYVADLVQNGRIGHFLCAEGGVWSEPPPTVDCTMGASCQVGEVVYPHGWRRAAAPYSRCNTCSCDNGELVSCTGHFCADTICPAGTWPARKCQACGSPGGCAVYETGCFSDPSCEDGECTSSPCI